MKKAIIALAALAISSSAFAGAKWTYVDAGYVMGDSGDESTDGYSIRGSFGFAEIWHIGASWGAVDYFGGNGKTNGSDSDAYSIYFGVNPALTDDIDLVVDLGYTAAEDEVGTEKLDSDSIFLRSGPRMMIGDNFELHTYVSLGWGNQDQSGGGDTDSTDVAVEIGGAYYFNPAWSIGADVAVQDDNLSTLYVRWSF